MSLLPCLRLDAFISRYSLKRATSCEGGGRGEVRGPWEGEGGVRRDAHKRSQWG